MTPEPNPLTAADDSLASLSNKRLVTDVQRHNMIRDNGHPLISVEFDVWTGNRVSMWNHMPHGADFSEVRSALIAIRDHLDQFIQDGPAMCPFSPAFNPGRTDEQLLDCGGTPSREERRWMPGGRWPKR